MQVWPTMSTEDIIKTIEQEIAKSYNEIRAAQADIQKASGRLAFVLTAMNSLKEKTGGQ